jgi:deazaflavin-dependent oxidoreductase (nitroreductase family)
MGDLLARLARLASRPRRITTRVTRLHAWLLRVSRGRLRRSRLFAGGQPVLSLTTTGSRSGLPRSTVVAYFLDGDTIVISGANLGSERDPAWCSNLAANPCATVVVDGRRLEVAAHRATGEEARRLWARWVALMPLAESARKIAGRDIPVFRLEVQAPDSSPAAAS